MDFVFVFIWLEIIIARQLLLQTFDFTADDLVDEGEIGRGAYGTVNRMVHSRSGTVMAVKVHVS